MISRRDFVKIASIAPLVTPSSVFSKDNNTGFLTDKNPVIKSITLFRSTGNFARFVGMNAYDQASKGINNDILW